MDRAIEIINLYLMANDETKELVEEMIATYKSGRKEPANGDD
jgi:hypothetical protein